MVGSETNNYILNVGPRLCRFSVIPKLLKFKAADESPFVCMIHVPGVYSNALLPQNHNAEQEIIVKNKLFHHLYENVRLS